MTNPTKTPTSIKTPDLLEHPLAAMHRLKALGLEGDVLDCALLMKACEKSKVSLDEIHDLFGSKVAFMVYCLSKANKDQFQNEHKGTEDYIEKLKLGTSVYPEILLIQISDRIEDLKNIKKLNNKNQGILLNETIKLFMPLYKDFSENTQQTFQNPAKQLINELIEILKTHTKVSTKKTENKNAVQFPKMKISGVAA